MQLTFANPLALWALLGLPAVVAIHFLQRRSQRRVITTLFLLQQMRRQSETGNRIDRLRTSIPLWLQLLMVLLFTWLLAGPRWLKRDAVQRIAIVLDSSASMSAFRPQTEAAVRDALAALLKPPAKVELTLLPSDPEAPSLYHGSSVSELIDSMRQWQPLLGVHEFAPSLRAARGLAGENGAVLLISDHALAEKLPHDPRLVAVGEPAANVGWSGVSVERKDGQWHWRAIVRNYGKDVQSRSWRAITAQGQASPVTIPLNAGEARTLSGPFPPGVDRLTLQLSPDAFAFDDVLPLMLPQPKSVRLHLPAATDESSQSIRELLSRFDDTILAAGARDADVPVIVWPPSVALPGDRAAIVFTQPPRLAEPAYLGGQIVAEPHPLTEGLSWQGLLARQGIVIPSSPQDRVLVWQGERPLLSLRTTESRRGQLLCHFDLATSNARKLPALAVLLHRFLEDVRREKVAPEAANFDVRQRLVVAHESAADSEALSFSSEAAGGRQSQTIPLSQAGLLRAPAQPAFFKIDQGGKTLLSGAAHFADVREADLSAAGRFDELAGLAASQVETTHEADPMWRLWVLALLGALLGSWWFTRDRESLPATLSASHPSRR